MSNKNRPNVAVVCVGETVVDQISEVTTLPEKNETSFVERTKQSIGGGSANAAFMLSQLGVKTSLFSHGGHNLYSLMSDGFQYPIDLSLFRRIEGESPSVFIYFCGEDFMTFFNPGSLNEIQFPHVPELSAFSIICLIGSRLEAYRKLYTDIVSNSAGNQLVVFSPAWSVDLYSISQLTTLLANMSILIVNQDEYQSLCHRLQINSLSRLQPCPEVIIETRAQEGCVISHRGISQAVPAIPNVHVVNSGGAGDTFVAGFIFGLVEGYSYLKSAQFGNTLSSFILEVPQCHSPVMISDYYARWKRYYG